MPFQIIRQDITKMRCDAIVNAANNTLLGGGGVDGMIHRAAGPELLDECRTLHGCETGQAKITKGYRLPAKHVIHTVGPIWQGGGYGERELLASCYRNSLELAVKNGCESVAFPLISSGIFGYPKAAALQVATETITDFLTEHDLTVYLVVYGHNSYTISKELYDDVKSYIDDNYVAEHTMLRERYSLSSLAGEQFSFRKDDYASERRKKKTIASDDKDDACPEGDIAFETPQMAAFQGAAMASAVSLEDMLKSMDESFGQMLLRKIDEKGMTDAQCYKRANIDRKLFSKIRGDAHYRPSKPTALAFAVALELSTDETRELLMKAGYALSHSSKFDIIVEYFIQKRRYDIFEINETLFAFDQALLGSVN